MITPQNLTKHELIGLEVEIRASKDPTLTGIKGIIIDETRNTLMIKTREKKMIIAKNICKFRFTFKDHMVDVDGLALVGRSYDRIKR